MAQLGEIVAFGGGSGAPITGVCDAHREESILCSSTNGIVVYDVPTRLSILSWHLASPDSLTVPARYVTTAGMFVAVKNNQELIYWDQSVTFASDFKALQLSETVHSLLAPPTNPSTLVAVYSTGKLELLRIDDGQVTIVTNKRGKKGAKKSKTSVKSSVVVLCEDGATSYIVVVCKAEATGPYSVASYAVQTQDGLQLEGLGRAEIENEDLGDLCILAPNASYLYSKWSAGVVCRTEINLFISESLFRLDPLPELGNPTGLTCFGDDALITLFDQKLSVFEIKYFTLQTSLELSDSVQSLGQCCHGYIFMFTCSGAVQGCTIFSSGPRPSLASALGKGGIIEPLHLEQSLSDTMETVDSNDLRDRIGLFSSKTMTHNKRLKICRELLKDITSPIVLSVILQIAKFLLDEEGCDDGSFVKTSTAPWHRKELLIVIRSRAFPVSLSGELYRTALLNSDWPLIMESLDLVTCIPEGVLTDMVEALLRLPSGFTVSVCKETVLRDQILWKVLSLPRNDALLLQPLMRLPEDTVLTLLEFLSSHIDCSFISAPTELWSKYEDAIDWISLILDSHFTRLILIPSIVPKIMELHDNVRRQLKVISNLSILGAINNAIKTSNHRDSTNWVYKLDRMEIDF